MTGRYTRNAINQNVNIYVVFKSHFTDPAFLYI
jgi:hypothetical protein